MKSVVIENDIGDYKSLNAFTNLNGDICFGTEGSYLTKVDAPSIPMDINDIQVGKECYLDEYIVTIVDIDD